jgi:outer membrane receptor protein involved in Fe transport
VQPVNLKGNSITKDSAYKSINRINVFPIARLVYNFSRTKSLNFNYQGNATQPTFSQLQPVQDFSNQQSITSGNPNLKPSINHNFNFSFNNFNFTSGKVLFTNLTFSTIRNQIVNNTINKGAGRQLSIPENVNGYYNVLGFYVYSRPYKNRKYVITATGSLNFNHNVNLIDSIRNIGQNWVINQGFNFEFNYKEWLEFGAGVSYGLNDVHYKNPGTSAVSTLQNSSSNSWTLSSNINIDITKSLIFKYDFDYTINSGLASSVSKNLAIMNASLEQQLFKKKNGVIKLAAYDLFKQNSNISRNVSANSITDTRTNKLTRYFMLTFTYRLQKFKGQQPQGGGPLRGMGGPARF